MIENRQCRTCNETLPLTSFRQVTPTSWRHSCRECVREQNREYSREYQRQKRKEQRELDEILGVERKRKRKLSPLAELTMRVETLERTVAELVKDKTEDYL